MWERAQINLGHWNGNVSVWDGLARFVIKAGAGSKTSNKKGKVTHMDKTCEAVGVSTISISGPAWLEEYGPISTKKVLGWRRGHGRNFLAFPRLPGCTREGKHGVVHLVDISKTMSRKSRIPVPVVHHVVLRQRGALPAL